MKILINGNEVSVTLEGEKNVAQFVEAITASLNAEKLLVQAVKLNGSEVTSEQELGAIDENATFEFDVVPFNHYLIVLANEALRRAEEIESASEVAKNIDKLKAILEELTASPVFSELNQIKLELAENGTLTSGGFELLKKSLSAIIAEIDNPYETLLKQKEILENFISSQMKEIPLMLQSNKASSAILVVSDFTAIFATLAHLSPLLKNELAFKIDEFLAKNSEIIKDILSSIENDDKVMLSDIIEYELETLTKTLCEIIDIAIAGC